MASSTDILDNCRSAIRELLEEHVSLPLYNMREADFRACLLSKLRFRFTDRVSVELRDKQVGVSVPTTNPAVATTSRVHAEVALQDVSGDVFDIVVLPDGPVEFTINLGATDVQKTLTTTHLAAAIEIKAAPTNKTSIRSGIAKDLKKFARLRRHAPHVCCFLVVIDKALALGVANFRGCLDREWRNALIALPGVTGVPVGVEVWCLDGEPVAPAVFHEVHPPLGACAVKRISRSTA